MALSLHAVFLPEFCPHSARIWQLMLAPKTSTKDIAIRNMDIMQRFGDFPLTLHKTEVKLHCFSQTNFKSHSNKIHKIRGWTLRRLWFKDAASHTEVEVVDATPEIPLERQRDKAKIRWISSPTSLLPSSVSSVSMVLINVSLRKKQVWLTLPTDSRLSIRGLAGWLVVNFLFIKCIKLACRKNEQYPGHIIFLCHVSVRRIS